MPIQLHIKHWSDRADRDLFFSILSVKNIGTISAGEWNVIGSDMRTLGYGFTNEGCRQHFQGLRRSIVEKKRAERPVQSAGRAAEAEAAAETAAETAVDGERETASAGLTSLTPSLGSPSGIDPTRNPITRRPGPGRGRPRKKKGDASKDDASQSVGDTGSTEKPSAELLVAANGLRPLLPASSDGGKSSSGIGETVLSEKAAPVSPTGQKRRRGPQMQMQMQARTRMEIQPPSQPAYQYHSPVPLPAVSAAWVPFDSALEHYQEHEPGRDNGQPSKKRQRLDDATAAVPPAAGPSAMALSQPATVQDDAVFGALADNDAAVSEDFPFEV